MDLKHEIMYRGGGGTEELMLTVKTEPRLHSPCGSTDIHMPNPATSSHGNGLFNSITSSNKRPRPDDWLSSPSPGAIPSSAPPPLTPSPGPPSMSYTVITNGYSSPMSSGSYDPYSPNGKIGKLPPPTIIRRLRDVFHYETSQKRPPL